MAKWWSVNTNQYELLSLNMNQCALANSSWEQPKCLEPITIHWAPGDDLSIIFLLCETALSKSKGNVISVLCSIENLKMLCNTLDLFCGVKENYWSITGQNFKINKEVLSAEWNTEFTFELCLHNPYILSCICWIKCHAMS